MRCDVYLTGGFVIKEMRKSGIFQSMFKFIAIIAIDRNYNEMTWCTNKNNKLSKQFKYNTIIANHTDYDCWSLKQEQIKQLADME
jgi:hypothetical protein